MSNQTTLEKFISSESRNIIKLDLNRIKNCLNYIGNPQKKFKSVIIGGTNGKGSVTFYLSSLACKFTGYKIGRYTSPHLVSFNERFVINEKNVPNDLLQTVAKDVIEKIKSFEAQNHEQLTEFEIYTVTAFELFAREKVNIAFLEVGLGGRLDATNIVDSEDVLCSMITNIALEHTNILGNSIEEIAFEKAGIIKEKNNIVTSASGKALNVIKERASSLNSHLVTVNVNEYTNYKEKNIELALAAWEVIIHQDSAGLRNFLQSLSVPGRFELIKPNLLIDCAHNPAAARELRKLLDKDYKNKKIVYIIGILDKDYKNFIKELIPKNSTVICTEPKSKRATKKELLKDTIMTNNSTAYLAKDIKEALKLLKTINYDLAVITGSIYLLGEAIPFISDKSFLNPVQKVL